jgi:signal transduction histidine kinase/ActR/RegA family two-component response regulator
VIKRVRASIGALGFLPLAMLVLSLGMTLALTLIIQGVVDQQERRLVHERGAEIAASLKTSVSAVDASLPLLTRVARLDRPGGVSEFDEAARPLLTGGVRTLGIVERQGGVLRVRNAVGDGPKVADAISGPRAALVRRALATPRLVTDLWTDAGGTHLVVAKREHSLVAYQESAAAPTRPIPQTPGAPYNDLEVAIYASPDPVPSKLVLASTGRALHGGVIDRRVQPVGADRWLLLTASRTPLVGGVAHALPWLVLAGGLLASLLTTSLVTVLSRRRRYALAAVDARTAELRTALAEKTDLQDAEREARALAEAANQAKSEFLSRMSHELRTPLNAILGFGQLLELDGLSAEHQDSVDHILKGGRHLLGLVDEILDISRIEAGTMTISVEPVELASALGDVMRLVKPLAAEAGIELRGDLPPADETYVLADRMRLRQVLLNVLSNAVKYNQRGGWVRVSVEPSSEQRIEIRIADSGPGIAPDKIDRLFMPFERLGAELGTTEGTGLGLALSKGLMERMGGTIRADSALGAGSVFILELSEAGSPVTETALDDARSAGRAEPSIGPATLLYVEDNLSNFQLVERVLEPHPQVRLIPAMQGGMALELAHLHKPDVIMLDLHLPDLPGTLVFERLRASPQTRDVPVIVVSADATERQVKRFLQAGAVDYLTKPLDLRRLLEVLRRHIHLEDDAAGSGSLT